MILKNTTFLRWILICLLLFSVNSIYARVEISLGATSSYNYDSNVFRSSTNVKSDQYYLIQPSVGVLLSIYNLSVSAGYAGRISRHIDFPQNNSADLTGFSAVNLNVSGRYIDIRGNYNKTKLERDSLETSVTELDPQETVERVGFLVKTVFPLSNERYNLHLQLGINGNKYSGLDAEKKNNIAGDTATELRYRYSGKTSLVYGYKANLKDVQSELYRNLDAVTQSLYLGARWLTTGKTSSHALIGYEILQLSGSGTSPYGGLNIDVSVVWKRKSYSKVTLNVTRSSTDSLYYGTGFLINNKLSLGFSHSLTNRWSVGADSDFLAYQAYAEYRDLGASMSFQTTYAIKRISLGVRSGYQLRHSLIRGGSGYSGYTASVDLSIRY